MRKSTLFVFTIITGLIGILPVTIVHAEDIKIKQISLGQTHNAAITENGDLYCWGSNSSGEIGNGTKDDQYEPVKIMSNVVDVVYNDCNCVAITENGDLYSWGRNNYGQIGNGNTEDQHKPVKVMSNIVKVVLGGHFQAAAITENGDLYCWGHNYYGEIGDGTTNNQYTPKKIMSNVVDVIYNNFNCAAITENGDLYSWGRNNYGQLGNGNTTDQHNPVKVMSNVTQVSLGSFHSAAITKSGDLYCWGRNYNGQVGNGTFQDQFEPQKIMSNVTQVDLSSYDSAAITNNGDLYCWGDNEGGRIGNGTNTDQREPQKIMSNVAQVVLGTYWHTAAITKNGDLYCWGSSWHGEIGDGTKESRYEPKKIMDNVRKVALCVQHSAAITKEGYLYCWGFRQGGQGADGTIQDTYNPTKITIPFNENKVNADMYFELFMDYAENYTYLCDSNQTYTGYIYREDGNILYSCKGNVPVNPMSYDIDDYDNDGEDELLIVDLDSNYKLILKMYEMINGKVTQTATKEFYEFPEENSECCAGLNREQTAFNCYAYEYSGKKTIGVEDYAFGRATADGTLVYVSAVQYDGKEFKQINEYFASASDFEGYDYSTDAVNELNKMGIRVSKEKLDFFFGEKLYADSDDYYNDIKDFIEKDERKISGDIANKKMIASQKTIPKSNDFVEPGNRKVDYSKISFKIINNTGNQINVDAEDVDEQIIKAVKMYTSTHEQDLWDIIINSKMSEEEKFRQLNELTHNMGMTNIKEGVQYLNDSSRARSSYRFLTTNDLYCAYNYGQWLNENTLARGALYADGLIFNYEALAYIDFTTYSKGDYPGVKKCKQMLKDFMEVDSTGNIATDTLKNAKKTGSFFKKMINLNNIVSNASMDELMDKIINCKSQTQLEKYQKQYADMLLSEMKVQQKIKSGDSVKVYMGCSGLSEALKYAVPILDFTGATANDIVSMIHLEQDISVYKEYEKFLITIYNEKDMPKEMRIAAYQLLDDIENGYYNRIISICSNFISFEKDMMFLDKSMLSTYLEKAGVSSSTTELFGEAIGTLTLATFISNIVIDAGDFVKQAAYTQAYAELSALYYLELEKDKEIFLSNPNAENAWRFYEDYNLLWKLRYKGEEQYLKMNGIKMYIFARVKSFKYDMKADIVNDNLNKLKECQFLLDADIEVPESVKYVKKAVIECPVDVSVYTKGGQFVATLKDGRVSDSTNNYGRFATVKESYNGEYAKIIYQSTDEDLVFKLNATDVGLVDFKMIESYSDNILSFDKVPVQKGETIEIEEDTYKVYAESGAVKAKGDLDVVDSNTYIKAKRIIALNDSYRLVEGDKAAVEISILPNNASNKSVEWMSSDSEVVSVTNGAIKALSEGDATITAKLCDSDDAYAEIKVNVVKKKETDENINVPSLKPSSNVNNPNSGNDIVPIPDNTSTDNQAYDIQPVTDTPSITVDQSKLNDQKKNSKITVDKGIYRITSSGENGGTVEYVKPTTKKLTKAAIPSALIINGKTYKVTSIAAKAFKNNKKLKQIDIGKNIKKIGKQAFYNCKKLNKLVIRSKKLTNKNVGSNTFKGVNKNVRVFVPESKINSYMKLLKKKGLKKDW